MNVRVTLELVTDLNIHTVYDGVARAGELALAVVLVGILFILVGSYHR